MKIIVLGSGTSTGIPIISCECSVCTSENKKNIRSRASVYFTDHQNHFVIDTGIDFRLQALREKINSLDYILLTHGHVDHIGGIDEVRAYNMIQKTKIKIFASEHAYHSVMNRYDYCFQTEKSEGFIPQIELDVINQPITINELNITPLPYYHGNVLITGFRINDFAYITDCSYIPDETYNLLHNLKILMIDAVNLTSHQTHFGLREAIIEAEKINAKQTYFTHIGHKIEHETINKTLPKNMELAFDGLVLQC